MDFYKVNQIADQAQNMIVKALDNLAGDDLPNGQACVEGAINSMLEILGAIAKADHRTEAAQQDAADMAIILFLARGIETVCEARAIRKREEKK